MNQTAERSHPRELIRLAALEFQKHLRVKPRKFCLITGAPRSGTSALSHWLDRHWSVAAFIESRILVGVHRFIEQVHRFSDLEKKQEVLAKMSRRLVFDYYANSRVVLGRGTVVDKEPLEPIAFPDKRYDKFLDNVRLLFPEIKFLFIIRDPVATVWSMTQRKWGLSLANAAPRTFSLEEHVENWCACADLILQYSADPNSYICQFGRLVTAPEDESRRIFDFLGIPPGEPFQALQTKEIGFSEKDREFIQKMTFPLLEALHAQGLSDISP